MKIYALFKPYLNLPRNVYILFFADIINSAGSFVYPFLAMFLTLKLGFSEYYSGFILTIVIAAEGGGVPVYVDENQNIRPAEAVIDKDLASSLLAARIKADEFYILTDVSFVYINYNKPNQEIKEFLNYEDTKKLLDEGQFSEGSMAPKIRACLQFIEQGGRKSVITEAFKLEDKSYGTKITMEYED